MKFNIEIKNIKNKKYSCIILPIFEYKKLSPITEKFNKISNGYIEKILQKDSIEGKIGQTLLLYHVNNIISEKILLIGCGKKENTNSYQYKNIIKNTILELNKTGFKKSMFLITKIKIYNKNFYWKVRHTIENINESIYTFNKFKTNIKTEKQITKQVIFQAKNKQEQIYGEKAIQHGTIISNGIKITKDLGNLPPNICNTKYLLNQSYKLINKFKDNKKIKLKIINKKEMKTLGMNSYLSVSTGSLNKPYMILIKYYGKIDNTSTPIVLIGKGVTFDTGGLCIKNSQHMNEMKYDMCGAATILGLMNIIIKLNLPLNIIGILATCENSVDGKSYKPSDIITTLSGKTVEILNTDAEGRLILCDVLTYVEKFNPKFVIDIATLTGSCIIALGHHYTGLISNNKFLTYELKKASKQTGDKIWQLPLGKEFEKQLVSNFADIKNIGGYAGGTITAGYFLSYFTKKYKWAHLDIAGTAFNKEQGATGKPIQMLSQFLLNISSQKTKK
ncbi:MAG: aminopeptidase A/I [Candidatus Westeberhardia cardiocondylae]|nr:aminopeptidase A/I [Candidatus Westeberhardia cardiocondylae]